MTITHETLAVYLNSEEGERYSSDVLSVKCVVCQIVNTSPMYERYGEQNQSENNSQAGSIAAAPGRNSPTSCNNMLIVQCASIGRFG